MGRLDEKFAKAGGVVSRVEKRIEDNLDALIARETAIATKTETVFARQLAPITEANKALDTLDSQLNLLSNQGPDGPLPGSEGSLDGFQPNPALTQPVSKTQPPPVPSPPEVGPQPVPFRSN